MIRPLAIASILALSALSGCAGLHLTMNGECRAAGFTPGTAEFEDCKRTRTAAAVAWGEQAGMIGARLTTGAIINAQAVRAAPPKPQFGTPEPPRQCIYWTPQGQRILQAVNGICPAHYGE